ncbi:hypothetical protein BDV28DRAFT_41567 [Aspergillus coremiiformis]|uniref:Uncharacterized protein n=1 Tax=Aspergillus coremiiformis TaxID=138285 RepID=A0A5N6ZGP3_9EURO|nr:hypothetical protein BDV28DRAFT_41567 [Aspergillus coremiiformis]
MASSPLVVPLKLDAFVLNPSACDGTDATRAKIAPLTQPNYSHLRLNESMVRKREKLQEDDCKPENISMLQGDVLRPIELHAAAPAARNSRVTNVGAIGANRTRKERLGVYLHWMLPRVYRSGAAATDRGSERTRRRMGLHPHRRAQDEPAPEVPVFPEAPNRWLVIRKLHEGYQPADADMDQVTAWLIESDCMRKITDFDDRDVKTPWDIEASASPYIDPSLQSADGEPSIKHQAEAFIGRRFRASDWDEQESKERKHISLSVLNSSNQLFADYQPHNINVFSMVDNFEIEGKGDSLTSATADYYVLGWQGSPENDILHMDGGAADRRQRLDALSLALHGADGTSERIKKWLESKVSARVICHGAMYNVRWESEWKGDSRPKIPADDVASKFQLDMPIAVGTTSLDALLAYINVHQEGQVEQDLFQLSCLLRAQSESIEDRAAAADELQNYNFAHFAGGTRYVLQIDSKNPAASPSEKAAETLAQMNESQALYDATARQVQLLRWELFSVWWKFSTDLHWDEEKEAYKATVESLTGRLRELSSIQRQQEEKVRILRQDLEEKQSLSLKEAIAPGLSQQLDPTLFVGNVGSGWPKDYLDPLKVRLDFQIPQHEESFADDDADYGIACVPKELQNAASLLIEEFLHPGTSTASDKVETNDETTPPLYQDGERDQWNNSQPWFPLFLEWEAEYTHINYEEWDMEDEATAAEKHKRFQYVVRQRDGDKLLPPLWEKNIQDRHKISGRILLLPQPVFSLRAQLEQLFNSVPEDELPFSKEKQDELLLSVMDLPFLSAPLDGFTNHLLTLAEGSHLKPNVRRSGAEPVPLKEAYMHTQQIGIGHDEIVDMGVETDLTPYGSLTRLISPQYPSFKPVTHGQFKFTQLNVIDKFGQAACVIDPTRKPNGPLPVYPCISEYYQPQMYEGTGRPNVVDEPNSVGDCQFIQVPPAINQPSRLHMNFVTLDSSDDKPFWRPVTEWENPIWGWVLVNYVNYGVQFFLNDGTFYREVRVAAPNNPNEGSQATDKWLPFKAPPDAQASQQLDYLIEQFTGSQEASEYLLAFMDLIHRATSNATSVPGTYSECVNSFIGRPLALVNAGLSLEIDTDAKKNQSTFGDQPGITPPHSLLPPEDESHPPTQYDFSIKLGDVARLHDGLVGYFHARPEPQATNGLELGDLYTPLPPGEPASSKIHQVDTADFPRLKAFWLDPCNYTDSATPQDAARKFIIDRNRKLTTFGFIMDPFTPVNAYSSILPVEPLRLPPWTWENALKSMTAFFSFGPFVVTDDVPSFDREKELKYDYKLSGGSQDIAGVLKLPSLAIADWSWLQPYSVSSDAVDQDDRNSPEEKYMAFDIGKLDAVPTWEKGPLTAIEGFLQMKKSITERGG